MKQVLLRIEDDALERFMGFVSLCPQVEVVTDSPVTTKEVPSRRGRLCGKDDIRTLFVDKELANKRLQLMGSLIRGQKGKRAALVITCAAEVGWLIDIPSYEQACEAFGYIGVRSNYYQQLRSNFTLKEKELILQKMKQL